jgi:hypothetical protein
MTRKTASGGFVALISVIIISAILLVLVFTLEAASLFARFDSLDSENKRISLELAEACVQSAMLKEAQNPTYAGGDCISLGGVCGGADPQQVCKICSVTYASGIATAYTRAAYRGAYTNLRVSFDTTPGSYAIQGWAELPSYGLGACPVP